ncbi:MAG: COR domain-containing protein, partial [Methylovulum sp.]|nr:COR domain-containing protein [Methylovulum sp.]
MSELARQLIAENKKTKAMFLDLGNCGLTEVPKELGKLVWLEELSFSSEWRDKNGWTASSNEGAVNKIARLRAAPFIHLKRLRKLWLDGHHNNTFALTDLSPLSHLLNLQLLSVGSTQVSDLSPLAGLAALQELYVGNTQVSDLSPLAGLAALQSLYAWGTPISDLSPLAGLAALQSLYAWGTPVSDLSPLAGLMALQSLYVHNTQVTDLSPLAGLAGLQSLDVTGTQVSDLSPLLPLIKYGIPVKWGNERQGICVQDCPLTNPPIDVVRQGNAAILRYFDEQHRVGTIKVREAKLLLVGQGKAGKTTLKRKLQNANADMPAPGDTTRGIDIIRLDEKMPQTDEALRINVWDFGGQDIQYYAHQFFLTGNSLYALVTNERIQDSVYLPYWLNIIEMLGKKSPVLLIQNKDAGHCQALRDEAALRARFANVHNRVYQTDLSQAPTEAEFAALRQEIIHQAALLPHIEQDYLASFAALRTQLEQEADHGTHYLRWEAYLKLMPDLSEELLGDYANSLTFLGVCQYFPNDALLREYLFLRPKWIIDALFTLLLHPLMENQRGHFNENDTRTIWQGKEYQGMHTLLVRMMEEFELCYRVEGNGRTYILPQRLPSEH